jgi:hypothetical protein
LLFPFPSSFPCEDCDDFCESRLRRRAASAVALALVIVIFANRPAPIADVGVHRGDVGVAAARLHDLLRANPVMLREESEVHHVHDVIVPEDDRVPLALRLLVMAVGVPVRGPGGVCHRHVVDVGPKAEAHGDVPPGAALLAQRDYPGWRHVRLTGDEEHHRQVIVRDVSLAHDNDLALRHVIVVRHRHVEVADARVDADSRLGRRRARCEIRRKDDQASNERLPLHGHSLRISPSG